MAAFQPVQPPTTEVPPLKEHIKHAPTLDDYPVQRVLEQDDEEAPVKSEDASKTSQHSEVEVAKAEVDSATLFAKLSSGDPTTINPANKDASVVADIIKPVDETHVKENSQSVPGAQSSSVEDAVDPLTSTEKDNDTTSHDSVNESTSIASEGEANTEVVPNNMEGDEPEREVIFNTLAPSSGDSLVDASKTSDPEEANPLSSESPSSISIDASPLSPPETVKPTESTETATPPTLPKEESGIISTEPSLISEEAPGTLSNPAQDSLSGRDEVDAAHSTNPSSDQSLSDPVEANSTQESISVIHDDQPLSARTPEAEASPILEVSALQGALSHASVTNEEKSKDNDISVKSSSEGSAVDNQPSAPVDEVSDNRGANDVVSTEQLKGVAEAEVVEVTQDTESTQEEPRTTAAHSIEDVVLTVTPDAPAHAPVLETNSVVPSKALDDGELDKDLEQSVVPPTHAIGADIVPLTDESVAPPTDESVAPPADQTKVVILEELESDAKPSASFMEENSEQQRFDEATSLDFSPVDAAAELVDTKSGSDAGPGNLKEGDSQQPGAISEATSATPLPTSDDVVENDGTLPEVIDEEREAAAPQIKEQDSGAGGLEKPSAVLIPTSDDTPVDISQDQTSPPVTLEGVSIASAEITNEAPASASAEPIQTEPKAAASSGAISSTEASNTSAAEAHIADSTDVTDTASGRAALEEVKAEQPQQPVVAVNEQDVPVPTAEVSEDSSIASSQVPSTEPQEEQTVPATRELEDAQPLSKPSGLVDPTLHSANDSDDAPSSQTADKPLDELTASPQGSPDVIVHVKGTTAAESLVDDHQSINEPAPLKGLTGQETLSELGDQEAVNVGETVESPSSPVLAEAEADLPRPTSPLTVVNNGEHTSTPAVTEALHLVDEQPRESPHESSTTVTEGISLPLSSDDDEAGANYHAVEPEVTPPEAEQRPRSPWTASYSVTSQGAVDADVSTEDAINDEVILADHEEEKGTDLVVEKQDVSAVPELSTAPILFVPSDVDAEASQPDLPEESAVKAAQDTAKEDHQASTLQRPWTPSYSVSTQGSPRSLSATLPEESTPRDAAPSTHSAQPVDPEESSISLAPAQEAPSDGVVVASAGQHDDQVPSTSESQANSADHFEEVEKQLTASNVESDIAQTSQQEATEPPQIPAPLISLPQEEISTLPEQGSTSAWAQSYAVSSQGSPLVQSQDLEVPKEKQIESASADTEPVTERSPAIQVHDTEVATVRDVAPSEESSDLEGTESVQQPTSPPLVSPSPRAWTPSYSVSRQGTPSPEPSQRVDAAEPSYATVEPISESSVQGEEKSLEVVEDHDHTVSSSPSIQIEQPEGVTLVAPIPIRPGDAVSPEEKPTSPALASPSPRAWTPSYSVSRQGSPSPESAARPLAADDAAKSGLNEGKAALDAFKDSNSQEGNISAEQAKPADEATLPNAQWTPSYSVSRQGSPLPSSRETDAPSASTNPVTVVTDTSDSTADSGVASTTQGPPVTVPAPEPSDAPASSSLASPSPRPWTPSYSVSRLGSPLLEDDRLLQTDESAMPAAQQPAVNEEASTTTNNGSEAPLAEDVKPTETWTPSYSVTSVGAVPNDVDTGLSSNRALSIKEQETTEHLSDTLPPASTGTQTPGEPFPASEQVDQLEPLKVNTDHQPSNMRGRYESTSSSLKSRFFPGGWYSSPIVGGKTSLDNARGEFSATRSPSSPTTEEPPAVATQDDEEKKAKWCTIM